MSRRLFILSAALLALTLPAAPATCGEPTLEEDLRAKAEVAIKAGTLAAFRRELAGQLARALEAPGAPGKNARELETLEHYFNVARLLDFKCDDETRSFMVWLLGQREFCSRFLHALTPNDQPAAAVAVLRRLKAVQGIDERLFLQHREMAIAFALVWDTYKWMRWANATVPDDRLEDVYAYYVNSGPTLLICPANLSHELLVHVIDHPLPKEERDYAQGFRNRANLGSLFFDIKWVKDNTSLYQGHNKSVPYTLMNIKKMSGVCMEQAYYATTIAKCLGVPAAYCCGTGARGGHAWAGILRVQGAAAGWDFKSGRYSYDHYWSGEVYDPTCRQQTLTDGEVAMTAGLLQISRAAVESADAHRNLAVFVLSGMTEEEPSKTRQRTRQPAKPERPALTPERRKLVCDLFQASVQANPCSRRTWNEIAAAAADDVFTLDEIVAFSNTLARSLDGCSPDFVCHTVLKFLAAVKNEADRDRYYEICFSFFRKRPDLAAELKVAQGRTNEASGKPDAALKAYVEAVAAFPKDGHVTQEAAKSIDRVLAKSEPKKAVETLTAVWRAMEQAQQGSKPEEREALRMIGENLLKYMKLAGMDKELAAFEAPFRRAFPAVRK